MGMPLESLQKEIEHRLGTGERRISMRQFNDELRALGYRFDRRMDCKSVARWMAGPRAGSSYPSCNMTPIQIDDGKSAYHFEARRDDRYKRLQELRDQVFAVRSGCIYEF